MTSLTGAVWKSLTWGSCFHVLYLSTWSVLQDIVNTPVATFHLRLPHRTLPSPWALDADSWPQWPASPKDFIACRIFSHGLSCLFLTTLTSSGHVETESCNTACPHSVKLLQTSLLPWSFPPDFIPLFCGILPVSVLEEAVLALPASSRLGIFVNGRPSRNTPQRSLVPF